MLRSLIAALASVLVLALPAGARAQATATLSIEPQGVSIRGGQVAQIFVTVRCTLEPGAQLLEGNVSVSQDEAFGTTGLNPPCDGRQRRIRVRVPAQSGTFDSGAASASAFLLFLDPATGETVSFSDARTITLRGS